MFNIERLQPEVSVQAKPGARYLIPQLNQDVGEVTESSSPCAWIVDLKERKTFTG
jgi:hypothetical protein